MDPDGSHISHCGRLTASRRCRVDVDCRYRLLEPNLGVAPSLNDGSIERAISTERVAGFLVPPGGTFSPKQLPSR